MTETVPSLRIHLLGSFRAIVNDRVVEDRGWSRRKPKLLVKVLALHPHHQLHREQAMELLWPESDPESAANSLNKAIHQARNALEPDLESAADSHFIITQGQQISLRSPGTLWIDADVFDQRAAEALKSADIAAYEGALSIYSGELLTEDLYEDWAAPRRQQLQNTHRDLLAKVAELFEAQGQYQGAIDQLKKLIFEDASNEEAQRRLMHLYARTGSKHQALRQYRECCEALKKELDADPEAVTVTLYEKILAGHIVPAEMPRVPVDFPERSTTHEALRLPRRPLQRLSATAVLSLTILAAAGLGISWSTGRTASIDSLAVLPIVNEAHDPGVEYLADGITESIINSVSQLPKLRVMARSTVFNYKGRESDPQNAGRELGVRAVLTGRVSRQDGDLLIRMELVNVSDGTRVWGEHYNLKISDLLSAQETISREVSQKLRLTLTGEEQKQLAKHYTDNVEAYQLYLKGRYQLNKRTPVGFTRGIEYFEEAIGKDPHYALAYAGLADSYILLGAGDYAVVEPRDAMLKAKAAAIKALEMDGNLAEAHTSLAFLNYIFDWDWTGAEDHYKRALELNPNYETAHHWYSLYLTAMLRTDDAIKQAQQAQELSPLSLIINTDLGLVYYRARQYDRAIDQFRKTFEIEPNFAPAHWNLGRTYVQKKRYAEAIAEFEKTLELERSPVYLASLGHAYAVCGKKAEAAKILDELKFAAGQNHVMASLVAIVYSGLGEKDHAFEWLNKAYEERSDFMIILKVDPLLDSLRTDSRFANLVQRVGL